MMRTNGKVLEEYVEVESGKNCERVQLTKAIQHAKESKLTLVIAKLDRLSRNAGFIFALRDAGVQFVCVDMPEANHLTIGLMAVLAEDEARRISERTKSALNEIKIKISNGEVHISKAGNVVINLGNPSNLTDAARKKGNEVKKKRAAEDVERKKCKAFAESLFSGGMSLEGIAFQLNCNGFTAPKGGEFSKTQVSRLLNK